MKNTTLIGQTLLGTWTASTTLTTSQHDAVDTEHHHHPHDHDSVSAYLVAHFLSDPRRGQACEIHPDPRNKKHKNRYHCPEVEGQVCVLQPNRDGHLEPTCVKMDEETNVSWSDVTAFFHMGIQVHSSSKPLAHWEWSTGDWIGPFNLIMAQPTTDKEEKNATKLLDQYVARYVASESMAPAQLLDKMPTECTLYNRPDDFSTLLGSRALAKMRQIQTNYSLPHHPNASWYNNEDYYDPYASQLETCRHGDIQPLLPQVQVSLVESSDKKQSTQLQLQYKIMVVPTPEDRAYRMLPELQAKFQGHEHFNIIGGPYCYGNDPRRGFSFDLNFMATVNHTLSMSELELQLETNNDYENDNSNSFLTRGCRPGLPCVPPAAMGGVPIPFLPDACHHNDNNVTPQPPHPPSNTLNISNMALMFGCYGLTVSLLILTVAYRNLRHQHAAAMKKAEQQHFSSCNDATLQSALLQSQQDNDDNVARMMTSLPNETSEDDDLDGDAGDGPTSTLFGSMKLDGGGLANLGRSKAAPEPPSPFGDLETNNGDKQAHQEDPLKEPLLDASDTYAHLASS